MSSSTSTPVVVPVILSGGAGTRLWPLSRSSLPKQLHALDGERTMLQQTAFRVASLSKSPLIVCNALHGSAVAQQMREVGIQPDTIILEPEGRGTAAAAAIASLLVSQRNPGAIVVLLPSDHVIADGAAFESAIAKAVGAAETGLVATLGIAPKTAHTGYGYIEAGTVLAGHPGVRAVSRFVEKPDEATAARYIRTGAHFWNSGIFIFRTDVMLEEMRRHCPDVLDGTAGALQASHRESEFVLLDGRHFRTVKNISIDYAVMEHTDLAAVVPCEIGWNDVGSWSALWSLGTDSGHKNVFRGDVVAHNATGSYVHSENILTAVVGVKDVVVVTTADAVLVMDKSQEQALRTVVDSLKAQGRPEVAEHAVVRRPWGTYQAIGRGAGYQVKRIVVEPGGRLSLQMHRKRAEHWVVVAGTARVTRDERVFDLKANESTFIPLGAKHRLENFGATPLHLIEVQFGAYLGEDDIVRFEDAYGRAPVSG